MAKNKKDLVLLYGNKTQADIIFKNELENLASTSRLRLTHILSQQPNYPGETGLIDEEKIKKLVPDLADRRVYLYGPVTMMDSINSILKKLGLPRSRIHFEKFEL